MNCEGLKENVEPIEARGRDPDGDGNEGIGGSEKGFEGGGVEGIVVVVVVVKDALNACPACDHDGYGDQNNALGCTLQASIRRILSRW